MKNIDIRERAKAEGVKLWQIAEECRITDSSFSRKLRTELPEAEKERIFDIIERISKENA